MNVCGNCYYSSLSALFCFKLEKLTMPLEKCPEHKNEYSSNGRNEYLLHLIDIATEREREKKKHG